MLGMFNRFFKKKTVPDPPNPIPPPPILTSAVYPPLTPSNYVYTGSMYMSGSYIPGGASGSYGTSQEELREKANKFKKFSVTHNQKASSFKRFSLTPTQTPDTI